MQERKQDQEPTVAGRLKAFIASIPEHILETQRAKAANRAAKFEREWESMQTLGDSATGDASQASNN